MMKPLLFIGLPLTIVYLASQADKKWPSGQPGATPTRYNVTIGPNRYVVETIPQGKRITAYDVQGRAITSITYALDRTVIDVNALGDYPENLLQTYHNQMVADVTQFPEKFGL